MIDKTGSMRTTGDGPNQGLPDPCQSNARARSGDRPTEIQKPTFGETINQMVTDVNSAQMQSAELRAAYERGKRTAHGCGDWDAEIIARI